MPSKPITLRPAQKLLKAVGKLDHTPANPGLPEAEYKDGYNGTSHSNIFTSSPISSLAKSVDAYMDDSDAGNISRLGHRRWCLNPAMQTTGFGKYGNFSAMWSFDTRRPNMRDWDIVAYPARGYMPTEYFSPDRAWSLIVNRGHIKLPAGDIDISIRRLDDALQPGKPLELNYKAVETGGYGGGPCVIFRPKSLDMASGRRYGVELKGATNSAGKPLTIRYIVEFADLAVRTPQAAAKKSRPPRKRESRDRTALYADGVASASARRRTCSVSSRGIAVMLIGCLLSGWRFPAWDGSPEPSSSVV